jgi:hypothetical protein
LEWGKQTRPLSAGAFNPPRPARYFFFSVVCAAAGAA